MAILNKGQTFSDGEQVTSTKLNTAVDGATFSAGAVDDVSTQLSGGSIIVKDGGVTTAKITDSGVTTAKIADNNITTSKIVDSGVTTSKIADSNVTTSKIADSNVTKGKIENVANMKVLGNTSGSSAAPQEVSILDEDNMASNSNTAIPTQQSVKAYVDTSVDTVVGGWVYSGATSSLSAVSSYTDWDLSSVVGTNRAIVMITVTGSSLASFHLRKNGTSFTPYAAGATAMGAGTSGTQLQSGGGAHLLIVTDENGIVEYNGSAVNYTVEAYQVLG